MDPGVVVTDNVVVENVIGGDAPVHIGIAIGGRHAPEDTHVTIIGVFQEDFDFNNDFYVCSN